MILLCAIRVVHRYPLLGRPSVEDILRRASLEGFDKEQALRASWGERANSSAEISLRRYSRDSLSTGRLRSGGVSPLGGEKNSSRGLAEI